jgi:ankyrin repeat protein
MSELLYAASQGDITRMKLLLAEGANIKVVDSHGQGVLFWAARGKNLITLRWLLAEAGVNISDVVKDAQHTLEHGSSAPP